MNTKLLFAILFLGFTLVLSSCKKDEVVTPTVSKTDLISRKWGVSELYIDGDGKKVVIFGVGKPANLTLSAGVTANDYFLFTKNGKLEVYSEEDKETLNGTWKFVNSEKQVQLTYDKTNLVMDIEDLTEKTSALSISVTVAKAATASEDERNVLLLGTLAGVVTNSTVKVKLGYKLIAK